MDEKTNSSLGTKAGGKYGNRDGKLPQIDKKGNAIHYQEYDVNNKIVKLNRQQVPKIIKDKGKDPTCIIAVIDGREITVWEDYINKIS